jgi:hypothetical protein
MPRNKSVLESIQIINKGLSKSNPKKIIGGAPQEGISNLVLIVLKSLPKEKLSQTGPSMNIGSNNDADLIDILDIILYIANNEPIPGAKRSILDGIKAGLNKLNGWLTPIEAVGETQRYIATNNGLCADPKDENDINNHPIGINNIGNTCLYSKEETTTNT